ncbi:type II CRISPR RNA-guided endonuclease Cas9 [Veillonella caviae]|uniref:type II CRISPR RNA-guided endonuclease Cas9 n=1 Tax=Veillonella caviae TaxID=248316 RepID=UPI0023F09C3F|nr:type II CRISPR RNA-guided endonuclease Cas9 [Veillonella caviae]MCI6407194.1 type II CRISPR RNA-guided endonuclease Cas9 [Veillonella caviae]MDY6224732.1 type II CRISPR RNA-guided endonuclease Cas9 [Veillonella caviae]
MKIHESNQRLTSHLKGYPVKPYFIGQDIGTNSVGWAVTDKLYKLLKFKSHKMWGSRLFDEGETAVATRGYRAGRRRLKRRKFRILLLQELFADAMAAVDNTFFMRLCESKYHYEDKSIGAKHKHILFIDKNYTDQDYFKEFPTIYHLRAHLMEHGTTDIRHLFLALHHIIKYRGNFLYEGANFNSHGSIDNVLVNALKKIEFQHIDAEIVLSKIKDILVMEGVAKSDKAKQIEFLAKDKQNYMVNPLNSIVDKESSIDDKKRLKAFATLVLGLKANLQDLFGAIEEPEEKFVKLQFGSNAYDEGRDDYAKVWGEKIYVIDDCKSVYDSLILMTLKEPNLTISQSKVKSYKDHQEDLIVLKRLLKSNKATYNEMFKIDRKGHHNYVLYIRQGKTESTSCSKEEFYKCVENAIKGLPDSDDKTYVANKINLHTFMPLQRIKDNGVIPYQLHKEELVRILDKAKSQFSFLNDISDGLTTAEKIVKLLEFRIPYYVGPLNTTHSTKNGGFAWAVRKESGRVLPWNFNEKIDESKSAEAFIQNLTNTCTYLLGEEVLPKQSLLYSEFMLLNELNNIRCNGKPLAVDVKKHLIDAVFKHDHKKMTKGRIAQFLIDNAYVTGKPIIEGIDVDIKSDLASYRDMERILGKDFDASIAEQIIRYITIFGESKNMLRSTLSNRFTFLTENQIKQLAKLRYRDWGRLSKKFLTQIDGREIGGDGTAMSIIEIMRQSEYNLMQLLGDKFSFMEAVEIVNHNAFGTDDLDPCVLLDEMALSPAVKRSVWQALRILDEIIHMKKGIPEKIFIEVARTNKAEKKKKSSRQERLVALYKAIKSDISQWSDKDGNNWSTEIDDLDASQLNSKKLYLYYTQLGRCMYTGNPIDLHQLNDKYDIDHIYPRSLTKDDSFDNLVLVEKTANSEKSDDYPIRADVQKTHKSFWDVLRQHGLISERKYNRLTRTAELTVDDLSQFVARQLVETNQSVKAVTTILKQMYPSTEVVYVKAENVSDFRHANDFIKVRSLNNHHHAKDAYLNIVVGNVYHERFTKNFHKFIEKNGMKRSYNLTRMFDFDIMKANSKTEKVWDSKTSMDTVRKMMASNDVRVTKRVLEQTGALTDATIYKATVAAKAKDGVYMGMKTTDDRLADVSKYGGMTKIKNAYYVIVRYLDKKNNNIKEIVPIPIYVVNHNPDEIAIINYVQSLYPQAKDIQVIYKKLCINQLVKINGFYYYLGGKTNSQIYIDSAIQLISPTQECRYLKLLDKYTAISVDNKDLEASSISTGDRNKGTYLEINENDNLKFYDYLVHKMNTDIFKNKKGNKASELMESGREKFISLSLNNQCVMLLNILNLITNSKTTFDIKALGITASRATIGTKVQSLDEFIVINESLTGLYSNEIKII